MSNTVIFTLMSNLISKKFYAIKEDATEKVGVYYAFNMLEDLQMTELILLAEEIYAPPTIDEPSVIPE